MPTPNDLTPLDEAAVDSHPKVEPVVRARIGATPVADAVRVASDKSGAKIRAFKTRLDLAFPIPIAYSKTVALEITGYGPPAGPNCLSLMVNATQDGVPIAGFDPHFVIVNPPTDVASLDGVSVSEDLLKVVTETIIDAAGYQLRRRQARLP